MINSGSSHDWKFTAISKYTRTIARISPWPIPPKRLCIAAL